MRRHHIWKALLALTLASAMGSFTLWSYHFGAVQTFAPFNREKHVLLLDPGHGGEDGGAVSVSGVPESGINLAIALKCEQMAGLFGCSVQLLRTEDKSLAEPDAETLREKKRSDLERRVELVNETSNGILISIHQNQFSNPAYSGAQVFYRPGNISQNWAIFTQKQLRQCLDEGNDRQAKEIPSDIYLMSHIECPAILIECGFLSNPEEDRLLQSGEYQQRIAVTILGSYLSYWGEAGAD